MADSFGAYLRASRKRHGLKQQEIADALGVSTQIVSFWETHESLPPRQRLAEIAGAYHLEMADCLTCYENVRSGTVAGEAGAGFRYICDMVDYAAERARTDEEHRWIFHSLSSSGFLTSSSPEVSRSVFNCAAAGIDIAYINLPTGQQNSAGNDELVSSLNQKIKRVMPDTKKRQEAAQHLWTVSPKRAAKSGDVAALTGRILGIFTRVIALIRTTRLDEDQDNRAASNWKKVLFPTHEEVERFWLDIAMPDPNTGVIGPWWIPISSAGTSISEAYMVELAEWLNRLRAERFLTEADDDGQ